VSRYNLIQFRVSDGEKASVRAVAESQGKTTTGYCRDLVLASLGGGTTIPMPERKGQADGSDSSTADEGAKAEPVLARTVGAIPVDAGTTPGSLAPKVPPTVADEIEESRLKADSVREAFIARRAKELHARGATAPVARRLAAQEWERR
jgi:hypothetical protein